MTSINFYKITSTNTDKVYVGSTEKDINERLNQHETHYRLFKDGKCRYITSFEILEYKDYKIELLENKICESKEERNTVECKYIINTPNTVNKHLPGRTPEQYYQDNKEQIDEYKRQYYQENKDYFQQYYQDNKEQLDEYYRQRYQNNKQELNQKHNCFCGGRYTKANKSQHNKTQKHQTFIRNQQPINNYGVINIYNAPNQ
jgi:hypothetical protein